VGNMNRAVMGVGKRFELAPGFNVDASYERTQTFGGSTGSASRDALSLGGEWLKLDTLKVSSRQEVRVDKGDPAVGGFRKVQVLSLNNLLASITKETSVFLRANYTITQNQTLDRKEAEALEATVGFAYRPVRHNWFQLVSKASQIVEMRPTNINEGLSDRSVRTILGVESIVELPFRLQASEKVAWRRATEGFDGMPAVTTDTVLWVNRLGYHITDLLDIAAEYRILTTVLSGDVEHGALFEAAYIVAKTVRLGVGYNFTRFTDDTVNDIHRNDGGFFFRAIGKY